MAAKTPPKGTKPAPSKRAPEELLLEADHLTKYYGDFAAVVDVSFSIAKGSMVGLLGPNGAGKTTVMRMLTGFIPPSEGAARIAGFDTVERSREARRRVGYLPESVPLYPDMTVRDYLAYMGTLRGMERNHLRQRVNEVVDLVQIGDYRDVFIGRLSKGFRQRVGISQAILHEPPVVILDEPTIGIDPSQVVETRDLIRSLKGDHTVLLSTHILPEVSATCDRVIILHEGQVVADGEPSALADRLEGSERIDVEVRGPSKDVTAQLRSVSGVVDVTHDGTESRSTYHVQARRGGRVNEQIAAVIVGRGWTLLRLQPTSMTLEEIFLELTQEDHA